MSCYSHSHGHGCGCGHDSQPGAGLLDVFAGLLGLTTAGLQGGTRLVRSVVEGALWRQEGCCDPCHTCYSCCTPCTGHHNRRGCC